MLKRSFCIGLLSILIGQLPLAAQSADRVIDNPQLMMVGARMQALGGTNPVIGGDINGMFLNPAVMGTADAMPIALSSQQLLDAFQYVVVNGSYPLDLRIPFLIDGKTVTQKFVLGFSYGSVGLADIPNTIGPGRANGIIRSIGQYSSGFDVFQMGAGTVFYDLLGFNELSFGASAKIISHRVDDKSRSTWSFDIGALGSYHINTLFLDRASLGVSILNFVSSPLVWDGLDGSSALPLELYIGGRLDMFEDQLSLFVHNSPSSLDGGGLTFGAETFLAESFYFRGSTDFSRVSYGTGLILRNIAGFGSQDYSMRIDYTQSLNAPPFDTNVNNMISVTILGESRPFQPRILYPSEDTLTTQKGITLSGIGPKFTTIRIYNNGELSRTTQSDRFGQWRYDNFPLREGRNDVFLKSYSIERDESVDSDVVSIISDTLPPEVDVEVFPERDRLVVRVFSEDDIESVEGVISDNAFELRAIGENRWEGGVLMPDHLSPGSIIPKRFSYLQLTATDRAGNTTFKKGEPFFVELKYPEDKLVHFRDSVRLIGLASPMVKSMKVNDFAVFIDTDDRFSINLPLKPGKNGVNLQLKTLNDHSIDYKLRVLRLVTYPDLDRNVSGRREIEFMSTFGVLEGDEDGFFRPDAPVTREYMARVMVRELGLELDETPGDVLELSNDYPYAADIKAAIEEGIMFAYPDRTFRPEEPLTIGQALTMMSNAGVIGEEETERTDIIMTRKELAKFLAYQPRYEIRIEDLIDWELGYD